MVSSPPSLPSRDLLLSMLRQLYAIRMFEESLYRSFMTEKMPGTMHQTNGQEAIAVGIGHALNPDDVMTSTHRGHGHAVAKGLPLRELTAEMYARETGSSGGMGGSMHIFDVKRGFLGTTGVVGAGVPIAVGAALALKLEGDGRIAVAFMGDGAANQGAVHEALNMAAVWRLPILFVCENNQYAVSMHTSRSFAIEHIADRAAGYGMPGETLDGNDVLSVYKAALDAVNRARSGGGPTFLECLTYRHKGHSRFEPATYRTQEELESWKARDPIIGFRKRLEEAGTISIEGMDQIRSQVAAQMDDALDFAHASSPVNYAAAEKLAFWEA